MIAAKKKRPARAAQPRRQQANSPAGAKAPRLVTGKGTGAKGRQRQRVEQLGHASEGEDGAADVQKKESEKGTTDEDL